MIKAIKSKLLTYLFKDWVMNETDLETLQVSKEFIKKRANEKLAEIGYQSIFEYNEESASELDWFYHLTGGHTHTDFFAVRPTDYSKAGEDENWDEDDLFS